MAFWRWTFAILVLPGTVLGWIPWLLVTAFPVSKASSKPAPVPDTLFNVSAPLFLLAGAALCLTTMGLFRRLGDGTPAPWDPPRRFVVRGPYRYVRNPMILGVILLLIAEALFFRSWPIAVWAVVFFIGNTLYFPWKEEPALRERFGADYRVYCENVRRWLPRLRPWDPPAAPKNSGSGRNIR